MKALWSSCRHALLAFAAVTFTGCGRDPAPRPPAPETADRSPIELSLMAGPLDPEGRLTLRFPLEEGVVLRARLQNVSGVPVQVTRSSYACYYFCSLQVVRVAADGRRTRLRAHGDLYPNADMKQPDLQYVTLQPGEVIERDLMRMLQEGFALRSIHADTRGTLYESLRADGLGEIRESGVYELTVSYSTALAQDPERREALFARAAGRDEQISLWTGAAIRSDIRTAVVLR